MKIKILLLFFLISNLEPIFSQNKNAKSAVGINFSGLHFGGGQLISVQKINEINSIIGFNAAFARNLTPWLNVSIPIGCYYSFNDELVNQISLHGDLQLHFGFFNGVKVAPYAALGSSFLFYPDISGNYNEVTIAPLGGLGVQFAISEKINLQIQANYLYNLEVNKNFVIGANIGLYWKFGSNNSSISKINYRKLSKTDKDMDGVNDLIDECPNTPGVAAFQGCPDSDADGIANRDDLCPDQAGPKGTNGCPDQDKDNIADKNDKCPDIPGDDRYDGCPFFDKDKDGVNDDNDQCPDTKGLSRFNGCPDIDGDSIPDNFDKCINEPGQIETFGCPDIDLDGIIDKEDKCPTYTGVPEKLGCPAANQKDLDIATRASRSLIFENGSSKFLPKALEPLNSLVTLLNSKKSYKLLIYGFGDEHAQKEAQSKLALERAKEVQQYLILKGINIKALIVIAKTKPRISTRKVILELK